VRRVLQEVFAELKIEARFTMLAFEERVEEPLEAQPKYLPAPFYALFIESDASDESLRKIGEQVERALSASFHYALCRRLEQLSAVRVRRIEHGAREKYQAACVELGQRAGDVKPCALHTRPNWARRLWQQWL
jgi:hypothetical protein